MLRSPEPFKQKGLLMSVDNPLVSVIIPAFNAEKYLSVCLDSVLAQTFNDWELIIADDGSTDKTGSISDDYASKDGRIQVIHTAKSGVSAARNACIERARGKYLAFIDADDRMTPDYLYELVEHAEDSGADITQCSFFFVDEAGKTTPDPDSVDAGYAEHVDIIKAYFEGSQGFIRTSVWAKLFRREVFGDLRFDPSLRVYEDACYVYEACKMANTVYCFKKTLYYYLQHGQSTTHAKMREIYTDFFTLFDRQRFDFQFVPFIRKKLAVREAETYLWLMRILTGQDDKIELWDLRKRVKGIYKDVIFSSSPLFIKLKLTGVMLMPHLYFALLKGRAKTYHEDL